MTEREGSRRRDALSPEEIKAKLDAAGVRCSGLRPPDRPSDDGVTREGCTPEDGGKACWDCVAAGLRSWLNWSRTRERWQVPGGSTPKGLGSSTQPKASSHGVHVTQAAEPVFDKKEQFEQIRSGLMEGERIYAVYDATGAGTGFIAATDKRVIVQDKSFAGKKIALVSLPYSRISSVAVTSNKSFMGGFFSSSSIAISAGTATHEVEFRGQDKAHHMHNLILWHITR